MQALKLVFLGLLLFILIRSAPVYYHTTEFNKSVEQHVRQIRSKGRLKEAILLSAQQNSVPVTAQNISITSNDIQLLVSIEYQVPLDLIVFQKDLTFHASGSGLLQAN